MRTIATFLLVLLAPMALLAMQESEAKQLIEQGNTAYVDEDYTAAIEAYESVETEFNSMALFLNLGNAWYRLDNMPKAILYYERARKLAPANKDVNFNLSKANQKIVDRIDEKAADNLDQWFSGFFYGRNVSFWPWMSVIFLIVGLACFSVFTLTGKPAIRKLLFYAGCTLVGFALLSIALAGMQKRHLSAQNEAIIMEAKVDVKTAPNEDSGNAFVLHEGTKVSLLKLNNGWYEIAISNGSVGWLQEDDLAVI